MKNSIIKFIVVLSLLIFSGFSHAQTGWITQSSGTSQDFRGVYFINSQTGWAYGFLNNIKKTTNGGINWISQNSGTNESFMAAYFKDENTGWMAGGHHYNRITIVSKTTNGGQSWNTQHYSSNGGCAMGSSFINPCTGWVACAANGRVLKTTNGGLNWIVLYTSVNVELHNCFFVNQYTGWAIGLNGSISKIPI